MTDLQDTEVIQLQQQRDQLQQQVNQLQQSIVESARSLAVELQGAVQLPQGYERSEGISSAWWQLTSLIALAHFNSGLDAPTRAQLQEIEKDTAKVMVNSRPSVSQDSLSREDIQSVMTDTTASNWLKQSLESAMRCDPVDAVNDAEVLHALLSKRCNEALGAPDTSLMTRS